MMSDVQEEGGRVGALPASQDRAFAAAPSSQQAVSPVPASIPSAAECEAIAAMSISDWAIEQEMERSGRDWHESYLALLSIRTKAISRAAQAIEARRAETGTGSVHESAVGSADVPNPDPQDTHQDNGGRV